MARGIGLACERCDFAGALYERIPFATDGSGEPCAIAADDPQPAAGYWADSLCGACRLPVRATHWGGADDEEPARCPRCGAVPLAFDVAMRELAAVCHSRAWLDYEHEQALAQRIEAALSEEIPPLSDAIAQGDTTTLEALDALAERVATHSDTAQDEAESGAAPTGIPTLSGLRPLIENAHDLAAAARVLRERLDESEAHSAALRLCIQDEAYLPGVPCPKCEQGHLVHWPLWS